MENLGCFNLFTHHFAIGRKLPSSDSCVKIPDILNRWLIHKDKNTSKPVCRTRSISFPELIDLDTFKNILYDLIIIYRKKYPYSEKGDFIETVFGHTIHELKRILDLNLDWAGASYLEKEYTFYYDLYQDQFIDIGIRDSIQIDYYLQYFKEILTIIESVKYDQVPYSIINKQEPTEPIQESKLNNTDTNSVYNIVFTAFQWTLDLDLRQKQNILTINEFEKLVLWVTSYFENDFTIPEILEPILRFHTNKGNIVYAFKELFDELHPSKPRPESLYNLIKNCFHELRDDNIANYQKLKEPSTYKLQINSK